VRARRDVGFGLPSPSELGGFEEFREFAFTCARNASTSAFAFSNATRNSAI